MIRFILALLAPLAFSFSLLAQCYPTHPTGMFQAAGAPTGCNEIGPTTNVPFLSCLGLVPAATGGPLTFTLSNLPTPASPITTQYAVYLAIDFTAVVPGVQVPGTFDPACQFSVPAFITLTATVPAAGLACPFLPTIPVPPLPFLQGIPMFAQATVSDPVQLQHAATQVVQFSLL